MRGNNPTERSSMRAPHEDAKIIVDKRVDRSRGELKSGVVKRFQRVSQARNVGGYRSSQRQIFPRMIIPFDDNSIYCNT